MNPDLVDRNNKSEVESVRYDMVNAMLLNEFLKEHRKVEEQQATIGRLETTAAKQVATITELKFTVAQQQKGLQTVTARLDEQAAQIQKVSARLAAASPFDGGLEASKAAPQVVKQRSVKLRGISQPIRLELGAASQRTIQTGKTFRCASR